jgi:hypothetical protein
LTVRTVLLACLMIVLGAIAAGVPLRRELRSLQGQLEEARSKGRGTLGRDLATLMSRGEGGRAGPERSAKASPEEPPEAGAEPPPSPPEVPAEESAPAPEPATRNRSDEIEAARTALELRRTQARAALVEDADPDDAQLQAFDAATTAMNQRLFALADELEAMLDAGDTPSRRDAMEFTADALDAMLAAEENMRGALDAEQIDTLDDAALDPFSYVDPALLDRLQGLDLE